MQARFIVVGLHLSLAFALAAQAAPLPEPGAPDSHARFLEELQRQRDRFADAILERYDRRIAEAPEDAVAAMERCRFLATAFYDDDIGENPREAEWSACVDDVADRFADLPEARVFAIESRWGDEGQAASLGFLAEPPSDAGPLELAAVHAHLVALLETEDSQASARHAERAMELDPSRDLRVRVAEASIEAGDRERARRVLTSGLANTVESWQLETKGALLVDLDAHDAALGAFEEVLRRGDEIARPFDYARALAAAGRIEEARRHFAADEIFWPTDEALKARFAFELDHGNEASARAAYDAIQTRGWELDPVGLERLALLRAHPGAAWRAEDLVGLILLAASLFALATLPAIVVLPVHAAGMLRARSSQGAPSTLAPFGLRHAWFACAAFLIAEVGALAVYPNVVFDPDLALNPDTARYALLSSVVAIAGVLLVVGRRIANLLARGGWKWVRTLSAAVLLAAGFHLLAFGIAYAITSDSPTPPATDMIRSIRGTFGVPASFLFAALLVPIAEEIAFRGVLLSAFSTRLPFFWANVIQAGLFGLLHVHPIVTPASFGLGLAAGWMTRASGSLRTVLLGHVLANAVACAMLI